MDLKQLAADLTQASHLGHHFNCLPISATTDSTQASPQAVLKVEVSELEHFPIFVTASDTQLLCIHYLLHKNELNPDKLIELNQYLLELSLPMPLTAFSIIDDYYVVYGALSKTSKLENIALELVTLAANANETLQVLEDFLA